MNWNFKAVKARWRCLGWVPARQLARVEVICLPCQELDLWGYLRIILFPACGCLKSGGRDEVRGQGRGLERWIWHLSALRHAVHDMGDNAMSIASVKCAGALLRMWDFTVSTQHLYSALQCEMQIPSFWGPLSSGTLEAGDSVWMSY